MDWTKKEELFDAKYRNGTTCSYRKLWKYIPKKLYDAVDDVGVDCDGYWAYLADGYRAYDHDVDCAAIHEYTITDFKKALKTIGRQVEVDGVTKWLNVL